MKLSDAQLRMIRSTIKQGWPPELSHYLPTRCGATQQEWQALLDAKVIAPDKKTKRLHVTAEGKKLYNKAKVGRYF